MSALLWQPSAMQMQSSQMYHFMQWASVQTQQSFHTYDELYQWSIQDSAQFWSLLWDYTQVRGTKVSAYWCMGRILKGGMVS